MNAILEYLSANDWTVYGDDLGFEATKVVEGDDVTLVMEQGGCLERIDEWGDTVASLDPKSFGDAALAVWTVIGDDNGV